MTARSHTRQSRRAPHRRSIRSPQREPYNAQYLLELKPPRRPLTLADVFEDES